MTEKRFYIKNERTIKDNQKYITDTGYVFSYKTDAETVCDLLNELHLRNKRLEEKIQRERNSFRKTRERWSKEAETKIKELSEENEQLKKEVEMLRNGLKAYDEALPLYLDCEDIMHFNNSELFEFKMKQMDFYKKYPNRVHYNRGDVE